MNHLIERYKEESRWVNWRYETRDGKITKVPYAVAGYKASSTDPSTWSNYDQASLASNKVGIIFTPDQQLLGIDLDHFYKDGILVGDRKEQVADLLLETDTYTEFSPSGEGFHLFLEVGEALPLIANKKDFIDSDGVKRGFECYTKERFFTFTGSGYGEEKPVRVVSKEEALRLLSLIGYPWGRDEVQESHPCGSSSIPDADVLNLMFSASNGDKIKALYNGDTSNHGGDTSATEMALCSHLAFWTGRDAGQIERLWLASPIAAREKTQKRKDYRDRTIANAISNCTEVYSGNGVNAGQVEKTEPKVEDKPISPLLSIDELMGRSFPSARYTVEPFFEAGTVNMVSAPPNTWKSWLLFYLSVHIASGTQALDKFATEKSGVMIVNEEDSARLVQDRFKTLNLATTGLPIYLRIANGSKLEEPFIKEILKEAKEKNIGVVMLDSLRSMHNAEENSSSEMQKVLDHLKVLAREGITVIFTHHHRKKSMFSKGDDAEASRGSSAINAALSGHISLEEEERNDGKYLIIRHLKSKAGEKIPPFELKIEKKENGTVVFGYSGEFKNADKKLAQIKDKILYILSGEGGWKSVKDFEKLSLGGSKIIRSALKMLVAEGRIEGMARSKALELGIKEGATGKSNEIIYSMSSEDEGEQETKLEQKDSKYWNGL